MRKTDDQTTPETSKMFDSKSLYELQHRNMSHETLNVAKNILIMKKNPEKTPQGSLSTLNGLPINVFKKLYESLWD